MATLSLLDRELTDAPPGCRQLIDQAGYAGPRCDPIANVELLSNAG